LKIKTKIIINLLLVVIAILSLYAWKEYQEIKHVAYLKLEDKRVRTLNRLAENLELPLWEMDEVWVEKVLRTEMPDLFVSAIIVQGEEGMLVSVLRDQGKGDVLNKLLLNDNNDLFYSQSIVREGDIIGVVKLYLTDRQIVLQLRQHLYQTMVNMLVLGGVIIIVLGMVLTRMINRPLARLLKAVQSLAKGLDGVALDINRKDELGLLVKGFNTMRMNIKQREADWHHALNDLSIAQQELLTLNENLELHVLKRTEELELINEHLQIMGHELEIEKNKAESANLAKSIFLANMSHELRTPMNAVLGFSRLLQNDTNLTEQQQEGLAIINRSGGHLLNLINDILDMAKIESGRIELEKIPFDLAILIRDMIDMMQERADKRGLSLMLDQSSAFPRFINADEGKIRQVLVNLLSNALKCTDRGGVVLRLQAKEQQDECITLVIEVEDTGRGIAPEDIEQIFLAFVQVGDQQDIQKGTGLGLAITQQYIELMGGTISVTSKVKQGSCFKVILPVEKTKLQEIESLPMHLVHNVLHLKADQPKYKVLIIEDHPENRLLLKRLLEFVGYQVKEANNGEEGVRLFQEWSPDFIWMDRRMPVMDGIAATRMIRALPEGKKVKIVAVTASVFDQERQILLDAGVNDIVTKPYQDTDIFECMARYLGAEYDYTDKPIANRRVAKVESKHLIEIQTSETRIIPEDLREELMAAVVSLDVEQSLEVILKIERLDKELAQNFRAMVDQFDFQAVMDYLNKENEE